MANNFSFKDLEKVVLKATEQILINGKTFMPGEIITRFDSIQIAGLNNITKSVAATGGFDNRGLVYWHTTEQQNVVFSQGVFSKTQLAIMTNSNIINQSASQGVLITETEQLESNDFGIITVKNNLAAKPFVYNANTGESIYVISYGNKQITIATAYQDVIVDYQYQYIDTSTVYKFGSQLLSGYLELEGRTRIKDDESGQIVTGILKIPKIKLMSDLSIRLGNQANPIVGTFNGVALPVGSRNNSYVSELYLLGDDIESDF